MFDATIEVHSRAGIPFVRPSYEGFDEYSQFYRVARSYLPPSRSPGKLLSAARLPRAGVLFRRNLILTHRLWRTEVCDLCATCACIDTYGCVRAELLLSGNERKAPSRLCSASESRGGGEGREGAFCFYRRYLVETKRSGLSDVALIQSQGRFSRTPPLNYSSSGLTVNTPICFALL